MTYSITIICDFEIGMCLQNPVGDWKRVTIFLFVYLSVSLSLCPSRIYLCLSVRSYVHASIYTFEQHYCLYVYISFTVQFFFNEQRNDTSSSRKGFCHSVRGELCRNEVRSSQVLHFARWVSTKEYDPNQDIPYQSSICLNS